MTFRNVNERFSAPLNPCATRKVASIVRVRDRIIVGMRPALLGIERSKTVVDSTAKDEAQTCSGTEDNSQ